MEVKKREIIKVPNGNVKKMAKAFGCSSMWISKCLNYTTPDSKTVQKIRHTALKEFGGVAFAPVKREKEKH